MTEQPKSSVPPTSRFATVEQRIEETKTKISGRFQHARSAAVNVLENQLNALPVEADEYDHTGQRYSQMAENEMKESIDNIEVAVIEAFELLNSLIGELAWRVRDLEVRRKMMR
jgi:hypothetical protein